MLLTDEVREHAAKRLEELRGNRQKYDSDMPLFAADCLTIRPKTGGDTLLRLNRVQRRVHAEMEKMRRETGRVRVVIVKARQPGISTYVGARFYHRTSRNRGLRAFILTHEQKATDNVFEMVQRYHQHNPHAPHTGAASAKELYFDGLDSGFEVGTAGTKGVGRSYTIQLLHWSEVAFSPNAEEHSTGLLQAIPKADDTEIVLESTANGIGGLFYNAAMAALRGVGEFRLIFIPWFEHTEYAIEPPEGWKPYPELAEYAARYKLDDAQTYWMDQKNTELAIAAGEPEDKICWKFNQEYPATVKIAFRASREGAYVSGDLVYKARSFTAPAQDHVPLVFGCDFATGGDNEGGDSNVFMDRQGRAAGKKLYDRFMDKDTVSVASRLARHMEEHEPQMCFLDTGGGGAGVYDILVNRGDWFAKRLTLINFGSKPNDDRKYANKRAEMWGDMRDWFGDPGGADIPDEDTLDGEITAPQSKDDSNSRTILEKKADIRKRLGFSPDGGDALALTFAETVKVDAGGNDKVNPLKGSRRRGWQAA